MEEHQSIARLQQGDIGGLEVLVRKYYLQAVRAAYLVVQDEALAEDIVQTSFISLGQKIKQFDDQREFRPWFFRSVINLAISVCRQQKKNISIDDETEYGDESVVFERLSEADPGLEENYITEETRQAIWQALRQLSPAQRAAIVLRYYLELSEDDMTQQLNRPKSTVKWLLFTARQKLRQLLRPAQKFENQPVTARRDEERI